MIFINARFLTQNTTGVQRFAVEICKELIKLRDDIVFLIPCSVDKNSIPSNFNTKTIGKKSGLYWEQKELPQYLQNIGNPLLLNLCNRAPVLYKNNVVVLHDVTFRRYPKSVSFCFGLFYRLIMPSLIKRAKKILTVSEFSKKEIPYLYPKCKSDIGVIYNAVDQQFNNISNNTNEEKYLLAVSSDYLHKNFESLVKAFLLLNDNSVKLKIVGSKGKIAEKYKDEQNIEFVGRVSDEELIEFYQNALAFIFPSLYEGFGIPPLEAQACGCPVISSNRASMPEILSDSVLFFDPENINDIADKMKAVIEDHVLRNSLVEKGFQNTSRFSWKDSAIKLNNIIIELDKN